MSYRVERLGYEQVKCILEQEGHRWVLDHIEKRDGKYFLNKPAADIPQSPSCLYVVGATLMALGNADVAGEVDELRWSLLGPSGQTDVTFILSRFLQAMYSKYPS